MTGRTGSPPPNGMLTTITSLVARSGHERFIAEQFERTFGGGREASSHLGTLLIQEEGGISFLISQFSDAETLEAWRASDAHRQMVGAFEAHALRELCTLENSPVRIQVPNPGSGPKWKILVASWVVTFPLLLTIIQILQFLMPTTPLLARIAIASIVMSAGITWFISPMMLRLTRTWRLKDQLMKIDAQTVASIQP
jgi:antibiotic biosynthesis monooxygenase (ABM) superfamily enzyme